MKSNNYDKPKHDFKSNFRENYNSVNNRRFPDKRESFNGNQGNNNKFGGYKTNNYQQGQTYNGNWDNREYNKNESRFKGQEKDGFRNNNRDFRKDSPDSSSINNYKRDDSREKKSNYDNSKKGYFRRDNSEDSRTKHGRRKVESDTDDSRDRNKHKHYKDKYRDDSRENRTSNSKRDRSREKGSRYDNHRRDDSREDRYNRRDDTHGRNTRPRESFSQITGIRNRIVVPEGKITRGTIPGMIRTANTGEKIRDVTIPVMIKE